MDETGVLLSSPKSLRVLVGKNDFNRYRGTAVHRTLIIAVECISADGRCLDSLIIWPAAIIRSTWTTHETPGLAFHMQPVWLHEFLHQSVLGQERL